MGIGQMRLARLICNADKCAKEKAGTSAFLCI